MEREKGSSPVTVQFSPASVDRRTLHRLEPALGPEQVTAYRVPSGAFPK